MANASWQAKPIENIEIVINGLTKRVSRYNSKLYKELVDFLNEGRAVKNLDLPEHLKAERHVICGKMCWYYSAQCKMKDFKGYCRRMLIAEEHVAELEARVAVLEGKYG